jgi:hypothetical protein
MRNSLFLTALVVSSAAAIAQAPDETPAAQKVGPGGNADEIVCVNQSEIGSRLNRRRVCRTRAEWAAHQAQYRQNLERAQNQTQSSCKPPAC